MLILGIVQLFLVEFGNAALLDPSAEFFRKYEWLTKNTADIRLIWIYL